MIRPSTGQLATQKASIYEELCARLRGDTDQMFFWLLLAQWAVALALALAISPFSYDGGERHLHFHVKLVVGFGAILNALPLLLIRARPGWWVTRHVIAVTQMLWSGVLIMVTGGRIETHFHIFGSLAFLAFYRDWKVVVTATGVVIADHLARGLVWPDSIYGVADPEWWRFLEHGAWIAFEDLVLIFACTRQAREMDEAAEREASLKYKALVESSAAMPFEWDREREVMNYAAPQLATLLACSAEELCTTDIARASIHVADRARVRIATERFITGERAPNTPLDFRLVARTGEIRHVRLFQSTSDARGRLIRGVILDYTIQKKLESELYQAQKLESVGRLAAGVAHELNTPLQFVGDSIVFVRENLDTLLAAVGAGAVSSDPDLAYLAEHYPRALDRALEGLGRVTTIVRSMKTFAQTDQAEMAAIDLNAQIASTLTVAEHEYKYVADIVTSYGELPLVQCYAGAINQVLLSVLVNAAQAIGDAVVGASDQERGTITLTTRVEGRQVVVSIADTGPGIPPSVRERIFDPFFTTREVGGGSGQGLAIARTVVVDKHGGTLTFDSEPGVGTTFHIRLPIRLESLAVAALAAAA